jgi:hypothetical protein
MVVLRRLKVNVAALLACIPLLKHQIGPGIIILIT